jgi:non-lysosomal glucosylceramidase
MKINMTTMKKILIVLFCIVNNTALFSQGLWEMPACAWTRKMGDRPVFTTIKIFGSPWVKPETTTKKGMPVGGIGTGGFMYNFSGSFGPFCMKPNCYEERFLSQAAFHIREEVKGKTTAYTLATEDVLPAWNRLQPGDAEYKALFPKATFDYNVFQSRISLLHFSPVIKDNYRETSYPAGIFLFKVRNDKPETVKLSFMFTFPNAPYIQVNDTLCGKDKLRPCRQGLYNKIVKDKSYTAIVMGADDPRNPPETQNTAWCIATSAKATCVELWDGESDGNAIWNDFEKDGQLEGKNLCESSPTPSGALCVSIVLKPNEERIIPFAVSWYFPLTGFGEGALWKKRYTEYFPENRQDIAAVQIAATGLQSYREWLQAVDDWTLPIAENPHCPDWLKAGALNELHYQTFGGSFWENGCVNQEKKYGNRDGQHIAGVMESMDYAYLETFDVRHHTTRVTRDLWSKIEKDIILTYSDIIASTTLGACTHDLGKPHHNPINKPDAYVTWYRPGQETTPWSEFSPKFIQQVFMYWKQYGDDVFLDDCWLSVIRSFNYQVATDKNNDGITEMTSSEYIDNKLLNAVLWIASLEALKEMSVYRKDETMEYLANHQLSKARPNAEKQFWNETLGYYQYNETIPFLMADAFIGQRCSDVFNLPPVLDEKRMASHFNQCFERLVKPLRDYDGDGTGDLGAANILNLESKPGVKTSEYDHEQEVWTGVVYNLAASMYYWGCRSGNEDLKRKALLTGKGVYMQCWLNDENGFWFNSPEAYWFNDMPKARAPMYQRVRGIWELMREVSTINNHNPK